MFNVYVYQYHDKNQLRSVFYRYLLPFAIHCTPSPLRVSMVPNTVLLFCTGQLLYCVLYCCCKRQCAAMYRNECNIALCFAVCIETYQCASASFMMLLYHVFKRQLKRQEISTFCGVLYKKNRTHRFLHCIVRKYSSCLVIDSFIVLS